MEIVKTPITVMQVYEMVLQQAQMWRDNAKQAKKENNEHREEICEALAQELYAVATNLERTEEINSSK